MQCIYCNHTFKPEDVRPYGPRGEYTCFDCAMLPDNKAATEQMFGKTLDACGPDVALGNTCLRPANTADIIGAKEMSDNEFLKA